MGRRPIIIKVLQTYKDNIIIKRLIGFKIKLKTKNSKRRIIKRVKYINSGYLI